MTTQIKYAFNQDTLDYLISIEYLVVAATNNKDISIDPKQLKQRSGNHIWMQNIVLLSKIISFSTSFKESLHYIYNVTVPPGHIEVSLRT